MNWCQAPLGGALPERSCERVTRESTVFRLLKAQAERAPEAVAVLVRGRPPLTYRRLLEQIETTVGALRALGLDRNDRVALVLPNGPELALAVFGVAAVATAAPLNPAYRREEFDRHLAELSARALIVSSESDSPAWAAAQARGARIIELAPLTDAEAGIFALNARAGTEAVQEGLAEPGDVAIVLPTSGTTSRPKMVPLTHLNLWASARSVGATLQLTPSDRCLSVMPLFHIHGLVGAVLASLAAGASVAFAGDFAAPRFFEWMEEFAPTWYTAVPTIHRAILSRASTRPEVLATHRLRFIRSSSAPLSPPLHEELERTFGVPVIQAYGMTEGAHQVASTPLPPARRKVGSVGVAAGAQVAVVDTAGNPRGPEETGEIVIRGPSVTSGYLNDPAPGESAFINGWLRTGDQGFLDRDGYLFITGRLTEIINRGGEKITPGEIDDVLLGHPAVAEALTFAVPHPELGEEVAAAVVLSEGALVTQRELQEFAAGRLADFKIPRRIAIVDAIPKSPTGKPTRVGMADRLGIHLAGPKVDEKAVSASPRTELERQLVGPWKEVLGMDEVGVHDDFLLLGGDSLRVNRQALAALDPATTSSRPTFVPPAETVEHQLTEIWEELLGIRPIGIRDNFFELGGYSLLAARMMDRIAEACGKKLPLSVMFGGATIEHLAKALVERQAAESRSLLVPIQSGGSKRPFFFLHGDLRGGGFYCLNLARLLGEDQPFYALGIHGQDGQPAPETIEARATSYIEMVRAVQPEGPYLLGGQCNGGVTAFEMARQLQQQGQRIDLLVLIAASGMNSRFRLLHRLVSGAGDVIGLGTDARSTLFRMLRDSVIRCRRFCRHSIAGFQRFAELPLDERIAWTLQTPKRGYWRAVRMFEDWKRRDQRRDFGMAGQTPKAHHPAAAVLHKAIASYVPRRYSGRVTLLWPDEIPAPSHDDPTMGWGRVATHVEVYTVPGGYTTSVTTHVQTLADQMRACLSRAQADGFKAADRATKPPNG